MNEVLQVILGAILALVTGWIYARVNKKALASWIQKGLKILVKDKNTLNKIENQTGVFFMESGVAVVETSPDNEDVERLVKEIKEKIGELKKAMETGNPFP